MASTVLPNGIIVPEKFSRDWYADLYHNWQELDNLLGASGPGDGTLTIQKNGDTVGTFSANQATNETINITVPDVNNGTLTIQKNGDTVGTFSANQATDETINITVPDVNNGTLTIQQNGTTVDTFTANSSDDKTVNIQCVDLTNNQTVAGNKEFTGTTTAHDVMPSATDTYNFGSPTAQWNNAYIKSLTINGVACGDILTHNVSEFVDVSRNQTIGGNKAFAGFAVFNPYRVQIKNDSQEIGVVPSSNQWNGINFTDKNNSSTFSIEQGFLSNGSAMAHFSMTPNIANGSLLRIFESVYNASTREIQTKSRTLIPDANNSRDLGTSTNKWKTINGINPGALSLPSMDFISLDTTGFDVTATTIGTFTSTIDGWAILSMSQKNKPFGIWILSGGYRATFLSVRNTDIYFVYALIPVRANVAMSIYCSADDIDSTRKVDWLRLFPCQGNV